MDFLFIHTPSGLKDDLDIWFIPVGTVALADYLTKNRISCRIINLRIEKLIDPSFDITGYIKKSKAKILGFDIQWYHQLHSTLKVIKIIKKRIPEVKIIVGGITASFFAKEIIENFPAVDYVIKGEAEIPLLKLIKAAKLGKSLKNIPNLIFRENKKIIQNKQSYTTSQKMLDDLCFSNLKLIKNHKAYLKYLKHMYMQLQFLVSNKFDKGYMYYYHINRGCNARCSYCGGSNTAQMFINKRSNTVAKSLHSVVRDLEIFKNRYGITTIQLFFNSFLENNKYLINLFKKIKESKIDLNVTFFIDAAFQVSEGLIDILTLAFKESWVILELFSVSEEIRKLNSIPCYSSSKFIKILDYLDKKNITTSINFNTGLPFETKKDFLATLSFIKTLKSKYKNIRITAGDTPMVPASCIYLNNVKYKIKGERRNLMDFYNKSSSDIGYSTNNFSKREILNNLGKIETLASDSSHQNHDHKKQ